MRGSFSWSCILAFASVASAALKRYQIDLIDKTIAPDGFPRVAIAPNGSFPGPLLTYTKGDSTEILIRNQLSDPSIRQSTSIHWHGLFQARTSGMDGPAMVNQCPIAPGDDFTYAFDTAGQTGSYWYHSHLSTQYCDGLRGSLIIYDPDDPLKSLYDVDDETTVITMADWYHQPAPFDQDVFFTTGIIPIADSTLINGAGRYNTGPLTPFSVINVKQGLRYRLRLVSISCRPFFTFSVDNHNLTVMELDGVEHDPVTFQNVPVYAAQRMSVILTANQTVGNYWIRAPPTGGNLASNPNQNASLALAILRYQGAAAVEPTTTNPGGLAYNESLMHPIAQENPGYLGSAPADVSYVLNIAQPNPPFFDINGISYIPPSVPVLLQILSGAADPSDFLPSEQIFPLPQNKIIDISIPGAGAHPFHLHGHNFDVVLQPNSEVFNYVNPARRDVVPINGGNTTFRFITNNPGAWFLHCHIDWHLEAGLAIVFSESPKANVAGPQSQNVTAEWKALCPTYNALPEEEQ